LKTYRLSLKGCVTFFQMFRKVVRELVVFRKLSCELWIRSCAYIQFVVFYWVSHNTWDYKNALERGGHGMMWSSYQPELFGPGHFVGLGLRLKSEIRSPKFGLGLGLKIISQ
jgi:hypothetical protein